jgi:hypothetical protein
LEIYGEISTADKEDRAIIRGRRNFHANSPGPIDAEKSNNENSLCWRFLGLWGVIGKGQWRKMENSLRIPMTPL